MSMWDLEEFYLFLQLKLWLEVLIVNGDHGRMPKSVNVTIGKHYEWYCIKEEGKDDMLRVYMDNKDVD